MHLISVLKDQIAVHYKKEKEFCAVLMNLHTQNA